MENTESKKYPYDDEIMTYDYTNHRYVLTPQGVFEQFGYNLEVILDNGSPTDPRTRADRLLKKVSQSVYLWLYECTMNRDWLEFILATYPPLRDWVREMLQAQLEYVLDNNFVNDFSGVNIAKGNTVDINWLRGRVKVADQVEQIANQFVPGLGYTLTYRGQLPCVPWECYHRGY